MLSLRARLFFIISLIVLAILGISLFLILKPKADSIPMTEDIQPQNTIGGLPTDNSQNVNTAENPLAGGQIAEGITVQPTTKQENQENAARQLARIFFERYNTYSSDNNYQNIVDVKGLVTPEYWQILSKKVILNPAPNQPFIGVTAKVLTTSLVDIDDTSAKVYLKANINEEKNGTISNRYQEVNVSLLKKGDSWLVSALDFIK